MNKQQRSNVLWPLIATAVLAMAAACGDEDEGSNATSGGSAGSGKGGSGNGGGDASGGEPGGTDGGAAASDAGAGGTTAAGSFLPEFESGSRLSVKQYQAGDMPPVFLSFYDTELETECSFVDVDGTLRCMPTPQGMVRVSLFADAACGESVGTRSLGCAASADWLVEREAGDNCDPTSPHAFRAVALEVGDPLYVGSPGDCTAQGVVDDTALYYRLEPETPAGDFVAGEAAVEDGNARLSVRRITAEDGAKWVEGIYDTSESGLCRIREGDPDFICVPGIGFHSEGYRNKDADCSEALSLASCEAPLFLFQGGGSYYRTGPAYTGDVYGGVGAACELVAEPEPGTYYEVGEEVAATEFAALGATLVGSGRLQRSILVDDDGTSMMPGGEGIYDTELAANCSPWRTEDGSAYCIPAEVPLESAYNLFYADAGCTEQLSLCGLHDCPHDVALQTDPNTQLCNTDFQEVLALGDAFTGGELYIWYSGREPGQECDGPFPTDDYGTIRRVEGPGTLDAFVELELVTE